MQNYIGQQINRYRIIERLGMGGMAVVYKAFDTRLERDVALKLIRVDEIPPSQHERLMKRFEREAKAMAKFSHPNIVPVYDYGEVDGSPYLVMEYIPGGTMKEKTGQPVPVETALSWIAPIADALAYAHEFSVVHRDVKPSNILFDQKGRPILTDFGVAKVLETDEATLTGTGMGVGTPEYMAPEQWRGKTSPATDQYALGVVLYELLTGQKPYTADTPAAIILMQANEPLQAPSGIVKGIPVSVEKVLYKTLATDPQDRYENMGKFAKTLQGLAADFKPKKPEKKFNAAETSPAVKTKLPESFTQDALDTTPVERIIVPPQRKQGLPNWVLWTGIGIIGLSVIGFIISRKTSLVIKDKDDQEPYPTALINEKDMAEMMYIPAGEFLMGNEDAEADSDEAPEHSVYLDAYWIYKYEVTNAQYRQCIVDGGCSGNLNSYSENEFPAVYISWYEANDYCRWAEGRLPTEAEWEKAARGEDRITYPWGESTPNCTLAQYDDCSGQLMKVGSFPDGASPYGTLDMAGNAWEWVADWYDADYYYDSPTKNPTGPESGIYRVLRGGSWIYNENHLRSSDRSRNDPDSSDDYYGFRCVASEAPSVSIAMTAIPQEETQEIINEEIIPTELELSGISIEDVPVFDSFDGSSNSDDWYVTNWSDLEDYLIVKDNGTLHITATGGSSGKYKALFYYLHNNNKIKAFFAAVHINEITNGVVSLTFVDNSDYYNLFADVSGVSMDGASIPRQRIGGSIIGKTVWLGVYVDNEETLYYLDGQLVGRTTINGSISRNQIGFEIGSLNNGKVDVEIYEVRILFNE
jgi:serine/threonine-protein kinase